MRYILIFALSLFLTACGPTLTPEQQAALDANIERNSFDEDQATTIQFEGNPLKINVNRSKTVAFATGVAGVTTLDQMERAIAQHTGCSITAPGSLTQSLGISGDTPLSASAYGRFGGQIPFRIDC